MMSRDVRRPKMFILLELVGMIVLIASLIIGSYLRLQPIYNAFKYGYGPTLYEMDPFLNYWISSKLDEYGLTYYTSLTQGNPETKVFWYPYGRDIPSTELPALPYISIITYYIARSISPSLTLYEWLTYLPIMLYIISVIGIYLTIRELYGPLPAAIASLTASLMFIDRQVAGFTVKYVLGLAFIFLAIYFHVRTFKRGSVISALLSGVLLGISAISWAGFNLVLAAMFLQYVITPLIVGNADKNYLKLWIYEIVPLTLFILLTPSYYNGYEYLIRNAGLMIPLGTAVVGIAYVIFHLPDLRVIRRYSNLYKPRLIYFTTLAIFGTLGTVALITGFVGIGGKGLAAMGLGSIAGVLTGTIAQYRSATSSEFIYLGGAPLVISLICLPYIMYKMLIRKDLNWLFITNLMIISVIATANVAYFFSYSNLVIALVSGCVVGELLTPRVVTRVKSGWFSKVLATALLTIYVLATILQGLNIWVPSYQSVVPTIIESGVGLNLNIPSWINTLRWVKNNTNNDAVIVAWWDYGYWISVVGERASLADGSTLNFTQIHLLARALTSDEGTAINILLKNFQIPPSKLYVATYEFFIVDDTNKRVYPGPLVLSRPDGTPIFLGADGAKAISAMFRIAGVDVDKEISLGGGDHVKIYRYSTQRGTTYTFVLPNWNSSKVSEALLYKMLVDAARTVWGSLGYEIYDLFTQSGTPATIDATEMKYFKPSYIAISRITSSVYLVTTLYKLDETSLSTAKLA